MKYLFNIFISLIIIVSCNPPKQKNINLKEKKRKYIMKDTTPKVIGIGGIFFLSKNPQEVKDWYGKNLGLSITDFGSNFESRDINNPDEINYLVWNPFEENTKYFEPSEKEFMINYRVQNIEGFVRNLKANGVTIVDEIEEYEYGKFVHIMDLDGNKIELWEPVDSVLTEVGGETTN
jgi:predicted enzyme related to lactoylglutathione lyase